MDELLKLYQKSWKKRVSLILAAFIILLIMALYFSTLGVTDTTLIGVLKAVVRWIRFGQEGASKHDTVIVLLRLSRVTMAIIAGFGLAISGTSMQAVTHNPMVSPFTIGVSNAAAWGASLSIVFGFGIMGGTSVGTVISAFSWAVLCMILVYFITLKVSMSPTAIVLSGIALNYFFGACTSVIKFFSDEHNLAQVVNWEFGSVNGIQWAAVAVVLPFVAVISVIMFLLAPSLNILANGDDETSKSLGMNPQRIRITTMLLAALATAAIISFTGVIGFVGLVAPHIARLIIGNDHRFLLPFSGIIGSMLILCADTIGRLIFSPIVLPVGIVVSFIGVPIFINLILTQRRRQ